MADVAAVPEVSLEEVRKITEINATLQRGAERKRASIERLKAENKPLSLVEAMAARIAEDAAANAGKPLKRIALEDLPPAERPQMSDGVKHQVPLRFRDATLDNFRTESDGQQSAREYVARWIVRARTTGDAMLALIGPVGCGKSHLLYAAANALVDTNTHFYARPWYLLADELRYGGASSYNPERPLEPEEVRAQLRGSRVLLLDEVRHTAGTAFDDTELVKLACFAYDNKLSVLVTSNVRPLLDVMGPAAASRFRQVEMDGRDARQTP